MNRVRPVLIVAAGLATAGIGAAAYGVATNEKAPPVLDGAKSQRIHYFVPDDDQTKTIIKKAGLKLSGTCIPGGGPDFEVTATSKQDGAFKSVGHEENTGDVFFGESPSLGEGDSVDIFEGNTDAGVESAGTIYWDTKKGQTMTIDFQTESNPFSGGSGDHCLFAGTATYAN